MKFKSLSYIALSFFIFKNYGISFEKRPPVNISGELCELTQSLKTGLNCNSAGCLYVPSNYSRASSESPLLYIRGLKQDPAPTTQALFEGQYNLGKLNQIVFATASADATISKTDIECLKKLSKDNKINTAAHSAGYIGLEKNAEKLKGNVKNLYLLDNFYDPQGVKSSVSKINPDNCTGFVTPHNKNRYLSAKPSCEISQKGSDGEHVSAVIKTLGSGEKAIASKKEAPHSAPVTTTTKRAEAPSREPASHAIEPAKENVPPFSLDNNFAEYSSSLSLAQISAEKNKSQKDKFSALQEGVVDQYIHRSVQTLGCDNFKNTLFFNGARLAALGLKNEGNIILGDSKSHGLLSRLSYNVETWCRLSQKNDKESAYQNCVKSIYPELEELSKYFFNFSQNNQDLDSNGIYQNLKQESDNPDSFLAKKVSSIQNKIKANNLSFKCKTEEGLNPFAIKNEKVNPTGKYSSKPPRDSALKAKIIRAARETLKLEEEESKKARDALSVHNTSRGVFGRLRDRISRVFGSREGDEIDPDDLDPHNGYENARSKKKCYRYTHIALASAGLTNRWHVSGNGSARNATEEFIPNLKKEDGSPYFSPIYPDETKRKTMKRGDWGGGPQVKSPAANKLLMDNLNRDKQGVYLVVYDNPYKKSPGHIATIFYNEDKKQWEEYSDYMAPVQGYSSRKSTYGYHYGGSPTNTIRAIYKLNDKEAKN
jgi:hypothetical protein